VSEANDRYQARYWHLGNQVPADTTFATKAETRAWLAGMETDILGGRHVNPSDGRETFGGYSARWLENRDLRPRTRYTYASQLTHILTDFETVERRKITPASVRAWHGNLPSPTFTPTPQRRSTDCSAQSWTPPSTTDYFGPTRSTSKVLPSNEQSNAHHWTGTTSHGSPKQSTPGSGRSCG
jgi:hypothetical protein